MLEAEYSQVQAPPSDAMQFSSTALRTSGRDSFTDMESRPPFLLRATARHPMPDGDTFPRMLQLPYRSLHAESVAVLASSSANAVRTAQAPLLFQASAIAVNAGGGGRAGRDGTQTRSFGPSMTRGPHQDRKRAGINPNGMPALAGPPQVSGV